MGLFYLTWLSSHLQTNTARPFAYLQTRAHFVFLKFTEKAITGAFLIHVVYTDNTCLFFNLLIIFPCCFLLNFKFHVAFLKFWGRYTTDKKQRGNFSMNDTAIGIHWPSSGRNFAGNRGRAGGSRWNFTRILPHPAVEQLPGGGIKISGNQTWGNFAKVCPLPLLTISHSGEPTP
jgi:hypothetical protein